MKKRAQHTILSRNEVERIVEQLILLHDETVIEPTLERLKQDHDNAYNLKHQ